jgi:hypothetical protein
MKSSKMVFDLRDRQKEAIASEVEENLRIVKEGGGESAVFIVDSTVSLEEFGNYLGQGFNLAHFEHIAIPEMAPYQLIRLELRESDLAL